MSAVRTVIFCIEKQKLIKAFEWAVSEYNRMNSAQVAAVRNGDGFIFGEQVARAGLLKDCAKYALIKHEEEHGC
jgi:phage-related protein